MPFTVSLDRILPGENGNRTLLDLIPDPNTPSPDAKVEQDEAEEILYAALKKLPDREARILELHFGLGPHREHTLKELSKLFGVSFQRIHQIKRHALKTLNSLLVL